VPGMLVDSVVVSPGVHHWQTYGEAFNPDYVSGPVEAPPPPAALPLSERKIIGRRALREIPAGAVVNLGIGLPETIAAVAAEEGHLNDFLLTVESGPIGGVPASGLSFGCSRFPEAIVDQPSQFDFYDGGGIDFAALGAVEIDAEGSVCVSHLGDRFAGVGGFVNISQSARTVVFCSTFTAGGLRVGAGKGRLEIEREGRHRKFVERVSQVCFHGPTAVRQGQRVLYVTERAVFALRADGLHLVEVAPGVDLQAQVLDLMGFAPVVNDPTPMNAGLFQSRASLELS